MDRYHVPLVITPLQSRTFVFATELSTFRQRRKAGRQEGRSERSKRATKELFKQTNRQLD